MANLSLDDRPIVSPSVGVPSLSSFCLACLSGFLEPSEPAPGSNTMESSWLTTNQGKTMLDSRLRIPLAVHAAHGRRAQWRGIFDLFQATTTTPESTSPTAGPRQEDQDESDWDASTSSSDSDDFHVSTSRPAEALPILDLSFVPLPLSARQCFRQIVTHSLDLAHLTSLSLAGCGLALGDAVDMLTDQRTSTSARRRDQRSTKGLLFLRLKDLSLAGLGARDESELRTSMHKVSTSFLALEVRLYTPEFASATYAPG